MSIIVEKKGNETPVALTDRFSKEIRRSSVLKKAKRNRFWERPQNDAAQKQRALSKIEARRRYHKLKKLGQV
jgi:ribosomal protein S21